jgi:hypothetical protein
MRTSHKILKLLEGGLKGPKLFKVLLARECSAELEKYRPNFVSKMFSI